MSGPVRANGGVLWCDHAGECQILLVHRPLYDDWSLPKGKCEDAETDEACALREVAEETGFHCLLGPELDGADYVDAQGRLKTVRYWVMEIRSGEFAPNEEVDQVEWMSPADALDRLGYPSDRQVVASFSRWFAGRS